MSSGRAAPEAAATAGAGTGAAAGSAGVSEPAGAAAYAGLQRAVELGMVGRDEIVVVINTGSGLKDVRAATQITTGMRVMAFQDKTLKDNV